ncbi:DUF302 domain-containing protein [bacterium]|nr:DUF302 domain-containing protein [bacterium]MBU1882919.1 DUF302 domain-containing protein [bacterium]
MKKIYAIIVTALIMLGLTAHAASDVSESNKNQDIQIYTAPNVDGKITAKTIDEAFAAAGFTIDFNNNMNSVFDKRFGGHWYGTYHLFGIHSNYAAKLAVKYPSIGLITPLSTSIYSNDKEHTMSISSLSLRGMSRITQIPMDNPDLIAYHKQLNDALAKALPNGQFNLLKYKLSNPNDQLATTFFMNMEVEEDGDIQAAKEDFQAEFEGELEPIGFLFPSFIEFNEEIKGKGFQGYDFFDIYSICKLDVIYPISKTHPEVGAFAPCSFYMYKKKGDPKVYMGFPGVQNWISATEIKDQESLKPLLEAHKLLENKVKELSAE